MEAALGGHGCGQLSYHLIIITKCRRPALKGFTDELKLILNEIAIEHKMKLYAIEVASDHIHMFISIRHTMALSYAIQMLKGKSAYLMFKAHPEIKQQFRTGHL